MSTSKTPSSRPASRERQIDEMVAFHVLEWDKRGELWFDPVAEAELPLPEFSKDMNAAWMIADKICERGVRLQLEGSKLWQARFYKSAAHTLETHAHSATHKSPAHAICLAALAVRGVDVP